MADDDRSRLTVGATPLLVDTAEAARLLSIGRTTLYQLVWSGELRPIHIGRSVRFRMAELEQFVLTRQAPLKGGDAAPDFTDSTLRQPRERQT